MVECRHNSPPTEQDYNAPHAMTCAGPAVLGKPDAGGGPVVELTGEQVRTYAGAAPTDHSHAAIPMTSASASLSADVQMPTSNAYVNGPSVSLGAGTWLVFCTLTVVRAATTLANYTGRISDGTNHYASTQSTQPSQNPHAVCLAMSAVITLVSTTTIRGQAATSAGSTTTAIKAATSINGSGNNASHINAVKIG